MGLLNHHRRMGAHRSFAVRFAYWNFIVNGFFTVVFIGPVMALTFLDRSLGSSVLWVSFLSVWALFATHAGGAIAAFAAIHSAEVNTAPRVRRRDVEGPMGRTTSDGEW